MDWRLNTEGTMDADFYDYQSIFNKFYDGIILLHVK